MISLNVTYPDSPSYLLKMNYLKHLQKRNFQATVYLEIRTGERHQRVQQRRTDHQTDTVDATLSGLAETAVPLHRNPRRTLSEACHSLQELFWKNWRKWWKDQWDDWNKRTVKIVDVVRKTKVVFLQPEARDNYTTRFRQLKYLILNEKVHVPSVTVYQHLE